MIMHNRKINIKFIPMDNGFCITINNDDVIFVDYKTLRKYFRYYKDKRLDYDIQMNILLVILKYGHLLDDYLISKISKNIEERIKSYYDLYKKGLLKDFDKAIKKADKIKATIKEKGTLKEFARKELTRTGYLVRIPNSDTICGSNIGTTIMKIIDVLEENGYNYYYASKYLMPILNKLVRYKPINKK